MKAWMYKNDLEQIVVVADYKDQADQLVKDKLELWYYYLPELLICLGEIENNTILYYNLTHTEQC